MAHNLETLTNGQTSFVSARQHAWHQLGTVLPTTFTAEEAIQHAQLGGWNVRKQTLQTTAVLTDTGVTVVPIPDRYATIRTNPVTGQPDYLGVVGTGYTPIQNEAHAELLNTLVGESGAHFETAGSLFGGRQVFITMKLPDTMLIGGVDPVDTYLVASNSHDGSTAFRVITTAIRVVCANTQHAAFARAKAVHSIKHTANANNRIQQARETLQISFKYLETFQAEAERMINTTITDTEFNELIKQLWPVNPVEPTNPDRRRRYELRTLLTGPTNAQIRGTRWAAYQAVTEYLDHTAPTPKTKDAATLRANRVVSGAVAPIKARAFELLSN